MNQVAHFTNIRKKIIQALSYAKSNIKIAMAWFTNNELMQALLDCINNGIAVDLILMDDEINHSAYSAQRVPGVAEYTVPG